MLALIIFGEIWNAKIKMDLSRLTDFKIKLLLLGDGVVLGQALLQVFQLDRRVGVSSLGQAWRRLNRGRPRGRGSNHGRGGGGRSLAIFGDGSGGVAPLDDDAMVAIKARHLTDEVELRFLAPTTSQTAQKVSSCYWAVFQRI